MAKVDILLPYWGDVDLLKLAVESVIAQTEQDWRLLVFDDCYPSEEPALYFTSLNDKRIVYYRHAKNIGITKNFNYALGQANAKYCVMFGCDDIMLPNYLENALQGIGDAAFYQPGVNVIDADGSVYLPRVDRVKHLLRFNQAGLYGGEKLARSLCLGNWLYFPSILWRTSVIKSYGFDEAYKIAEDLVLELTIIKDGGIMSLGNDITFLYRRFSMSLSSIEKSKGGVRFGEEAAVYTRYAEIFSSMGWHRAARAARWRVLSRVHQLLS